MMLKLTTTQGVPIYFVRSHIQIVERDGVCSIIRVQGFGYSVTEDHESIVTAMTSVGAAFARDEVIDVSEIAKAKKDRI
jgi:pyrroline-5-carboxylate reductase